MRRWTSILLAPAAARRLTPDLVLVDVVLPQLDGFRVTRAHKAFETPPLAVIVSFAASSAVRTVAHAVGADGFLPTAEFAEAFDDLLDGLGGEAAGELPAIEPETSAVRPDRPPDGG